ncbi:MAG TPA: orotate phosphoribosyltransferase [Steroidobacteraceae bacterium]|nr:orotate phosphoribosyltransferase [Steroidobacteraceae bacterium]
MSYKSDFITLCIELNVLRFDPVRRFQLKSGRLSPYFFNAGLFNTGRAIEQLGHAYAAAITAATVPFDMLFGPAYKGIPLVTATAVALSSAHARNLPFAFNRKEAKDHGEGGNMIGSPLAGRVLIIDDVITAGTAIRESVELIRGAGAQLAAVVLALDRQERGQNESNRRSAVQEVEAEFRAPCISIVTLDDLIEHLDQAGRAADLAAMREYRDRYGIH